MENCGIATNESDPARIVAAAVDPKVIKAAALLVAPARVRSEASVRREHIRAMRGYLSEKRLDPLFSYRQAVERAKSGISTRNMADMRRMNKYALGTDLDRFHSLANEKLNTTSRHDLFKICRDRLGIKNTEGSVSVDARCSIEINILRYAQNHSTEDPCADAATVDEEILKRNQLSKKFQAGAHKDATTRVPDCRDYLQRARRGTPMPRKTTAILFSTSRGSEMSGRVRWAG